MDPKLLNKDFSNLKVKETTSEKISEKDQANLVEQILAEFKEGSDYLQNKNNRTLSRLKLYNNQKRDPDAVGDTTLYSVMQTLLSVLYSNVMTANFQGWENGDEEIAKNLYNMAKYDYIKMKKAMHDYFWIWNALFFGHAPTYMPGIDRDKLLPRLLLLDPLTFIRDPKAEMIDAVLGFKGLTYWGNITEMKLSDMEKDPSYFNLDKVKYNEKDYRPGEEIDQSTMYYEAKSARDEAQGLGNLVSNTANKMEFIDWQTFNQDGKRVRVVLHKKTRTIVRYHCLRNGENDPEDFWRLVGRSFSPMPNNFDAVTVPDFVEDKHRARAKMLNLGLDNAEAMQYSSYLYDDRVITEGNKQSLMEFEMNKFTGVSAKPSDIIAPIPRANVGADLAKFIMDTMDLSVQKAAATPETQQGILSSKDRTLGELELATNASMTRNNLGTMIFAWSELDFWNLWYYNYKNDMKDGIDVKMVRISNVLGSKPRPLTRENIIMKEDPDIEVISRNESMQQRIVARQAKSQFANLALQLPQSNKAYIIKNLGESFDIEADELDIMIPKTPDELQAEDENVLLSKGQKVPIRGTDNHIEHIQIHLSATDTIQAKGHIFAHREAIKLSKTNPEMIPPETQNSNPQDPNQPQGQTQEAPTPITVNAQEY